MSSVALDEKEIPWPLLSTNLKFPICCLNQLIKKKITGANSKPILNRTHSSVQIHYKICDQHCGKIGLTILNVL